MAAGCGGSRLAAEQPMEATMTSRRDSRLWVLIADGEHARVVAPTPFVDSFASVEGLDSLMAHRRSSDLGTERPGRVHESASTTRHAIEPRHDLHREAKHAFSVEVAAQMEAQAADFDRLVVVAPPRALHDLRAALGPASAAKLVATLERDLVNVPDGDLGPHLVEWWAAPHKR
jgi:protein required for attachment to host cells